MMRSCNPGGDESIRCQTTTSYGGSLNMDKCVVPPKLSELSSLGSVITGGLSHFSPQPISSVELNRYAVAVVV
jgi:hypothetical protein